MKALFIGRFQPFHNGHLQLLLKLYKTYELIIIGIGSSQYSHTTENPFTLEERKTMISTTLQNNRITNATIISIPDLHDPPNWVNHVTNLTPNFDVVITNNAFTKQLFQEQGYTVKPTPLINREQFSGRNIRKKIKNQKPWKSLVPLEVYNYIKKINGETRIRQ
jgi:nicotinamide-nucleotide adenylyltransferase